MGLLGGWLLPSLSCILKDRERGPTLKMWALCFGGSIHREVLKAFYNLTAVSFCLFEKKILYFLYEKEEVSFAISLGLMSLGEKYSLCGGQISLLKAAARGQASLLDGLCWWPPKRQLQQPQAKSVPNNHGGSALRTALSCTQYVMPRTWMWLQVWLPSGMARSWCQVLNAQWPV